jgi:hypothetical protein
MRHIDHREPATRAVRRPRPARSAAAAIVALALGPFLVACGSGSSSTGSEFLSTKQTKLAIEESILSQRHLRATVVCPTEVVREKGVTFQCVATTPSGVKTVFHVVEANARGYVEYSSATAAPEKKQSAEKPSTKRKTPRKKP